MIKLSYIALPLCALGAALVATPLAAADQEEQMVVTGEHQPVYRERVSFRDLDLRSWSHQQALKRRVHKASERVCTQAEGPIEANQGFMGGASCTQTTYDDARPQVRAAIARAKTGELFAMSITVSGPVRTR